MCERHGWGFVGAVLVESEFRLLIQCLEVSYSILLVCCSSLLLLFWSSLFSNAFSGPTFLSIQECFFLLFNWGYFIKLKYLRKFYFKSCSNGFSVIMRIQSTSQLPFILFLFFVVLVVLRLLLITFFDKKSLVAGLARIVAILCFWLKTLLFAAYFRQFHFCYRNGCILAVQGNGCTVERKRVS